MSKKNPEDKVEAGPIPAHLVAGPLGVGKTTTILEWIRSAPTDEYWAILVNEYGEVAIDGELFSGSEPGSSGTLYVKAIAGGCICCGAGENLASSVRDVVETVAPHRMIIEASGLADLSALKVEIGQHAEEWGIELLSTLGVLDARRFQNPRLLEMPYWSRLLQASDVIFGSKADLCDSDQENSFLALMEPYRKQGKTILTDRRELVANKLIFRVKPLHAVPSESGREHVHAIPSNPEARGWVFPRHTVFSLRELLNTLNGHRQKTVRMKGVFQTDAGPVALQSVDAETIEVQSLNHCKDSRLEVILASGKGMEPSTLMDLDRSLQKLFIRP